MDWNAEHATGLLLPNLQDTVANMLPAHLHDITAPLRWVKHKPKCEMRHGPDGMARLKLSDLVLGPCMKPDRLAPQRLDVGARIILAHTHANREPHQLLHQSQPMVRRRSFLRSNRKHRLDVLALEPRHGIAAELFGESLKDAPICRPGRRLQRQK